MEMHAGADMAAVISALNGKELHGRQLRVSEAHERAERPNRGGFGGRRRK